MGTSEPEKAPKRELDDSGCIQDESPPIKKCVEGNGYTGQAQLLDLSDDVLLYILRYCSPMDLKSLGFSCPRLGTLIRDRSLWQHVDARGEATGCSRLAWMLANTLHQGTDSLMLEGYAYIYPGCQGQSSKCEIDENTSCSENEASSSSCSAGPSHESDRAQTPYPLHRQHARLHINAHPLPRFSASPSWNEDMDPSSDVPRSVFDTSCPGPVFTITPSLLTGLRDTCPHLTSLTLSGCHINCRTITISQLPSTLKKLSLQGTKCFNMPMDKSFLFKIQDYLPGLEELDVSECEWMEPATLLPLSKMRTLRTLKMRNCYKMSEFVAYASLATRYGFKALKDLDLRGCPVSDSEVTALGWLHALTHLQLSVCNQSTDEQHQHSKPGKGTHCELDPWELQEPSYFNSCAMLLADKHSRCTAHEDEDITQQVMAMKRRLRRSDDDGSNGNSPEARSSSPSSRNTPETKPKIKTEDDQDDPKKITLRSRSKTVENESGDTDKPGPSKRKRNHSSGNDTHGLTIEIKTRNGSVDANNSVAENVEAEPSVYSKNSNSVPKTTPKKTDKNNPKNGESSVPSQTGRVTRSNARANETPKEENTNDKSSSNKLSKGTPKGKLSPKDTPKGKSSSKPSKEDTPEAKSSPSENAKAKLSTSGSKTNKIESTPTRKSLRNQSKQNTTDADTSKSGTSENTSKKPNKNTENTKSSDSNKKPERASFKYSTKRKAENTDKDENNEVTPKRPAYMTRRAVNEGASTSKSPSNSTKNEQNPSSGTCKKASGKSYAETSLDTSKNTETDSSDSSDDEDSNQNNGIQPVQDDGQFIRFRMTDGYYGCRLRQNCPPELVRLPFVPNRDEAEERLPLPPPPADRNIEPSHHLLYVNVGERFHAVYRLSPNRPAFGSSRSRARVSNLRQMINASTMPVEPAAMVTDAAVRGNVSTRCTACPRTGPRSAAVTAAPVEIIHAVYRLSPNRPTFGSSRSRARVSNLRQMINASTMPVEPTAMVTDAAVKSFGRSEADDMNYVLIGPNGLRAPRDGPVYNRLIGPGGQNLTPTQRPDRVALQSLSITGFSHITDRSLIHLVEAAPHLRLIDFRGTSVTEQGVENFKALRPECEVLYGPMEKVEKNE